MSRTVSRRSRAKNDHAYYAFDDHGDLVFEDLDDQQGSTARPTSLEHLSERRQLALSWGAK